MYITETNLLRKNNNFDLVRLVAAFLVFIGHCYHIRKIKDNWIQSLTGHYYPLYEIGLIIFFVISGFLVCRSLILSPSAKQYLRNRFLRIWPAFAVCTIVVFVAGIYLTTLPLNQFLFHSQSLQFLFRNLTALSSTHWLPGVFKNAALNPPVWTIPVEVRLYLLLLIVFLVIRLRFRQWLLFTTIICLLAMAIIPGEMLREVLQIHNIRAIMLGLYFCTGACLYLYKDKIPYKFSIWLALLAYWIILLIWFPAWVKKLQYPFFAYSFLWMALRWPKIPFIKADFSYGFYLYAWPVQAIVQKTIGTQISFMEYLLICTPCISILAMLSWFLVEKKALAYKFNNSSARLDHPQGPEDKTNAQKQNGKNKQ